MELATNDPALIALADITPSLKINQFVRPFHFTTLDLKNILILNGFHVIKTFHNDELNF